MAQNITKILFRRGTDVVRRTGGGDGVTFEYGEPAFNIDTKRLYVGDSSTVGGAPIGIVNHGAVNGIFQGGVDGNPLTQDAIVALTANGADIGDLIYDSSKEVLYHITDKAALSAVPEPTQIVRYNLLSQLDGTNGVTAVKADEVAQIHLDTTVFNISSKIGLLINTTVGTPGSQQTLVVDGDITTNSKLYAADSTALQKDLTVGLLSNLNGNISAYGEIFTYPFGTRGRNSTDWYTCYSLFATNSGAWNGTGSLLTGLLPLPFKYSTNGALVSTYSSNCSFGINTAPPSFKGLSVQGLNTTTVALSVQGAIIATGDVVVFSTSDETLKKNIEVIPNALEKVNQIRGVTFDWNCDFRDGKDVGVIAQEIEKILPEAVSTRSDGTKAVKYDSIIPLLIEAIKELNKKIT